VMLAATICYASALTAAVVAAAQEPRDESRFDVLVREDFFAGVAGDTAALDRAMRLIEKTLAADPSRADALVWHGAGLVTRAGQAFTKGDAVTGSDLWQRGVREMNEAVSRAPDNVAVLIPRGAVLLELSRSLPDPVEAKALLTTGVSDYEKVLTLQAPYFRYLSEHSRGELLFGLAEGLHRLGQRERARTYFERIAAEAPNSEYGRMATAWIRDPTGVTARRTGCVGCHRQ
jgi:tetratricopeptide (TPR) repeat protein